MQIFNFVTYFGCHCFSLWLATWRHQGINQTYGLVQETHSSIAKAHELRFSCTNPSKSMLMYRQSHSQEQKDISEIWRNTIIFIQQTAMNKMFAKRQPFWLSFSKHFVHCSLFNLQYVDKTLLTWSIQTPHRCQLVQAASVPHPGRTPPPVLKTRNQGLIFEI